MFGQGSQVGFEPVTSGLLGSILYPISYAVMLVEYVIFRRVFEIKLYREMLTRLRKQCFQVCRPLKSKNIFRNPNTVLISGY